MKCESVDCCRSGSWSDVLTLIAIGLVVVAIIVTIAKGGCDCEGHAEQCEAAHEDLYMIVGELEDSHNRDIQELKISCEAGRCNCNCDCDCDCDCEAGRCDCEDGRCDCDCDCDDAPEPAPEPVVELESAVEYKSSCPGGVCPQTRPSRRGLFGWRR